MAPKILMIAGTLPFLLLGFLHVLFTVLDTFKPKRLVPRDATLMASMTLSAVRMAPDMTMWRAWVGFNLSHGLGAMSFGLVYLLLAISDFDWLAAHPSLLYLPVAVSAGYFAIAAKYWFSIPMIGTGLGTVCFLAALILS